MSVTKSQRETGKLKRSGSCEISLVETTMCNLVTAAIVQNNNTKNTANSTKPNPPPFINNPGEIISFSVVIISTRVNRPSEDKRYVCLAFCTDLYLT